MDYGKFYGSFQKPEEANRNPDSHAECERKYEVLMKELMECKAQLELLRVRDLPDPAAEGESHSNRSAASASPAVSCEEQQNGSDLRRRRHADPRSAYTPSPRLSSDGLTNGSGRLDQPHAQDGMTENARDPERIERNDGKSKASSKHNKSQKPLPLRDRNLPPKTAAINRLARPKTAAPLHQPSTLRTSRYRPETAHPTTNKYDYYKYYGSAGQGAKTSWAHNLPLGYEPPYAVRGEHGEFAKGLRR